MNKIIKTLFLSLFVITSVFINTNVASAKYYAPGTLLKIKGVKGAAVYQIGNDGRKYVYPDQNTFNTWYDDFSDVLEVELEDIDSVDDGGTVTFQPGTRLITHQNTAKVYAVGEDGELTYIPNEETARRFYGNLWYQLVSDIDPGLFAIAYRIRQGILSDNNLPEGSLIEEEDTGDYYIIEDGQRRKVLQNALRIRNLIKKHIIKLKRLSNVYDDGDDVDEDDDIEDFEIGSGRDKVRVCHKPELVNRTISVSSRALKAHLAHGDYRGACEGDVNDDDDDSDDNDDDDDNTATSTLDVMISDIDVSPSSPIVNATTTITAYVKNSGTISLVDYQPVFNVLTSLADYNVRSVTTSTVSVAEPLDAGETATIVWDGYFQSGGEKVLSVTADYADSLDEDNEDNNTRIESVTVAEEMVDISVYDIVVSPSSPVAEAATTITVQIKNTGNMSLTETTGILSYQTSFADFQVTSTSTAPVISEAEPFDPNEVLEMIWTGYFELIGEKSLSFTVDFADELSEVDETNNVKTEDITVEISS